jgi:sulfatase maturation enzyme AslB (radical SAM superfamily)
VRLDQRIVFFEPIGQCNLKCKYCYTRHTDQVLRPADILSFARKYIDYTGMQDLHFIWMGRGEATLYAPLAGVINTLNRLYPRISHTIQTNGLLIKRTVNGLQRTDNLQVVFSIDGLQKYHEENRGEDTFNRTILNLKCMSKKGIALKVVSLVKPDNYKDLVQFEHYIQAISPGIKVAFSKLQPMESIKCMNRDINVLPPISSNDPDYVEMQVYLKEHGTGSSIDDPGPSLFISVGCNGKIYSCCELQRILGDIDTSIEELVTKFSRFSCDSCPVNGECYGDDREK